MIIFSPFGLNLGNYLSQNLGKLSPYTPRYLAKKKKNTALYLYKVSLFNLFFIILHVTPGDRYLKKTNNAIHLQDSANAWMYLPSVSKAQRNWFSKIHQILLHKNSSDVLCSKYSTVQKELYNRNSHWLEGIVFLHLTGNILFIGTHPENLWTATEGILKAKSLPVSITIRNYNLTFSKLFLWNQTRGIGHRVKKGEMLPLS